MTERATFAIRVRPGASRTAVGAGYGQPPALVVAVTARAVDGKANEAVIAALAEALGVPRRALRVVTGATSRTKVIEVSVPDVARVTGIVAKLLES